ncbi:hypothetical protein MJ575_14090 [Klebsiella pneumoniae]|nr:hypothetical protein MJ575_14090 [Klebsiella pneumoniae]
MDYSHRGSVKTEAGAARPARWGGLIVGGLSPNAPAVWRGNGYSVAAICRCRRPARQLVGVVYLQPRWRCWLAAASGAPA